MEMIKDFEDGQHVFNQLLVTQVDKCVTTQGRSYLNVTLQDSSGSILGKKWDVFDGDLEVFKEGNIVAVEGEVLKYKGSLQFKIISGAQVSVSDVDVTKFVPQAPVPREELEKKLNAYMDSLEDKIRRPPSRGQESPQFRERSPLPQHLHGRYGGAGLQTLSETQ